MGPPVPAGYLKPSLSTYPNFLVPPPFHRKFSVAAVLAAVLPLAYGAIEGTAATRYAWEEFKVDHGKIYDSQEEEGKRFQIFVKNMRVAEERNAAEKAAGGSAVHGITRFSDLTQEEFSNFFLTSDVSLKTPHEERDNVIAELPAYSEGDEVDWTGVFTTPVKNQRQCGSCWAFSATEQFESDIMRELNTTIILSPQQTVSCDKTSSGCNGGWTEHAYNYQERAGGVETEDDYPYRSWVGNTGSCKADESKFAATHEGYTTVSGESNMASYVQSTGPLSICLDANTFNSYTGGIMKVCGNSVDHCVQAVGVLPSSTGGYWKVRNSWGTTWGESGYIRLAFGSNTCDITNDPTYVNSPSLI